MKPNIIKRQNVNVGEGVFRPPPHAIEPLE